MSDVLVDIANVQLNYNKVRGLNRINISFHRSSIHAVIGEHGSGKSSLGLMLCGLAKPDSGTISIDNQEYSFIQTKVAKQKRVRFVHQQLMLNPYFTVAETLFFRDTHNPVFLAFFEKKIKQLSEKLFR